MKVFQHETRLRTAGGLTVTDITEDVQNAVRESGVVEGIAGFEVVKQRLEGHARANEHGRSSQNLWVAVHDSCFVGHA